MKFSKDDKIRIYDIISRFESVFLGKSQETNLSGLPDGHLNRLHWLAVNAQEAIEAYDGQLKLSKSFVCKYGRFVPECPDAEREFNLEGGCPHEDECENHPPLVCDLCNGDGSCAHPKVLVPPSDDGQYTPRCMSDIPGDDYTIDSEGCPDTVRCPIPPQSDGKKPLMITSSAINSTDNQTYGVVFKDGNHFRFLAASNLHEYEAFEAAIEASNGEYSIDEITNLVR